MMETRESVADWAATIDVRRYRRSCWRVLVQVEVEAGVDDLMGLALALAEEVVSEPLDTVARVYSTRTVVENIAGNGR